ncbi:MAG: ArsR/SmtB family transcription factor [Peptostreptococcaceae bacterium]
MDNLSKAFKALSDETRLNILILVSRRNICQKGVSKHLEISDSAVSQHIKVLKDANLIKGYKEGYYVIYHINQDIFNECLNFLRLLMKGNTEEINKKLDIVGFNCESESNCKSFKKCCMRRE